MRSVRSDAATGPPSQAGPSAAVDRLCGDGLDGRRAIAAREAAADGVHERERRRAGCEGEEHGPIGAPASGRPRRAPCRQRGSGSASPSRRRGRSARATGRACRRRRNSRTRAPDVRHALAREADQRRRQVDRDNIRAAARQLDRERAGAAAGVEHAPARAGRRAASRAAWRACGRGRRARWRGSARPARPRSAATRHRPRCDRNRFRSARGARYRRPSCISRTPADRRCRDPSAARR